MRRQWASLEIRWLGYSNKRLIDQRIGGSEISSLPPFFYLNTNVCVLRCSCAKGAKEGSQRWSTQRSEVRNLWISSVSRLRAPQGRENAVLAKARCLQVGQLSEILFREGFFDEEPFLNTTGRTNIDISFGPK
jgi:hypothetical protein